MIGIACLTLIVVVKQCCRRRLKQEHTYPTSTADQVVLKMIHMAVFKVGHTLLMIIHRWQSLRWITHFNVA